MVDSGHITEGPLDRDEQNVLWKENIDAVPSEIRTIAQRVVQPLISTPPGNRVESIVYAVHGSWGTGKSSFLRLVRAKAHQLATADNVADRVHFAYYNAAIHEGVPTKPRVTLAMSLLSQLGLEEAREEAEQIAKAALVEPFTGGRTPEPGQALQTLAERLAMLVDFPNTLAGHLSERVTGDDGQKEAHSALILIDELDRCDPSFVYEILRTVRHWSEAPNQVYLLAIDEQPLRQAIERQMNAETGYESSSFALQKYVQHAIRLPQINNLRIESVLEGILGNRQDPEFKTILDGRQLVSACLIGDESMPEEELLEYANPRALKRTINAIRWPVAFGLRLLSDRSVDHTPDDRKLVLKEALLEYRWPNFFRDVVARYREGDDNPRNRGSRQFQEVLRSLENECREKLSGTSAGGDLEEWDLVEFIWNKKVAMVPGLNMPFRRDLARFLSLPPYWFPQIIREDGGGGGFRSPGGTPSEPNATSNNGSPLKRPFVPGDAILSTIPEVAGIEADKIRDRFYEIYFESELADSQNDGPKATTLVRQLHDHVQSNRNVFGPRHATDVGIAAITAEKYRDAQLAYALYFLAQELDPNNSRIIQNFADFIISFRLTELYDTAHDMLKTLDTPPHDRYRPAKTMELQARLLQLQDDGHGSGDFLAQVNESQIESAIARVREDPFDRDLYLAVLQMLDATDRTDDVIALGELANLEELPIDLRYVYHRAVADVLAKDPRPEIERRAMDMYRELIEWPQPPMQLAQLRHNYALLLDIRDYEEEAGRQWYRAYNELKNDSTYRQAYGEYLRRIGKHEVAVRLIRSQELGESEETLFRQIRPLPKGSFLDDLPRDESPESGDVSEALSSDPGREDSPGLG